MSQRIMDLEKEERGIVSWFKEELLPKLLRDGHFPVERNSVIEKCEFDITERWTDHFASCPYFLDLVVNSNGNKFSLNFLVKFSLQNDKAGDVMHPQRLFYNEAKMYNEVLPTFRQMLKKNPKAPADLVDDLCSKCYYAHFDKENHKKSVLVFANLRTLQYRPAESKIFLDFDHCATAIKQLARFHSMSFSLKMKYPELLEKIKDMFVEARFFDDPSVREHCEIFHDMCNQRAVNYLLSLEKPVIPNEYVLNFRRLLSRPFELMVRMLQPEEPLAIICHGDYCRNNLLFRYEDGRVADAKMFDFQTSRYCSPSIDLTFFMYLNISQELRDKHLDDLLSLYYNVLVSSTSSITDVPEKDISDRFPFRLFMDDFARHAIYAYFHVAFFHSMMVGASDLTWEQTSKEQGEILCSKGGESVSKCIADVIIDFYKRKFYMPCQKQI